MLPAYWVLLFMVLSVLGIYYVWARRVDRKDQASTPPARQ